MIRRCRTILDTAETRIAELKEDDDGTALVIDDETA